MRLTVDHATRYAWGRPVRGLVQSHRLTPASNDGQKVLEWNVTVTGGAKGGSFRDGAGDLIQSWTIAGPESEIEVRVTGVVETSDTAGVLRGHKEIVAPEAWLRETMLTEPDVALSRLAMTVEAEVGKENRLALAHALSEAVAGAIEYTPGATHAGTCAAEALAAGKGVCQDHAHALIACARSLAIPARYVSGYLFADAEGKPHEAAHAWAELHVPGLGWVGFDPANLCCPDARYIRVGCGFDASDAAPIRGVARGLSAAENDEALEVAVAVAQAEQ